MKPETKAWLDKLVPLLAHLKEGGKVRHRNTNDLYDISSVNYFFLTTRIDLYTIVVEPRVIYVHEGAVYYASKPGPGPCVRFIEDLNWKPDKSDLDADHHLPEPSKKASDYMKTV